MRVTLGQELFDIHEAADNAVKLKSEVRDGRGRRWRMMKLWRLVVASPAHRHFV